MNVTVLLLSVIAASPLPRMQTMYMWLVLHLLAAGQCNVLEERQLDFGLRVFSEVSSQDKNVVFSPYGVTTVMSMVQLGASGATLNVLKSGMGFSLKGELLPLMA